jgi:hypothetical protein
MGTQRLFIAHHEARRKISQPPRIIPININMVNSKPLMEILQIQLNAVGTAHPTTATQANTVSVPLFKAPIGTISHFAATVQHSFFVIRK